MTTTELITSNPWRENYNNSIDEKLIKERKSLIMDELFKIARRELREDENTRHQSLKQFRDWINKNEDIVNCPTDDNFLLRFLRIKKFSNPMAEQTLLKYLNFRKRFKHYTYDADYMDSKIYELVTNGYLYVSPYRDCNGRRVILYDVSKFDINKYNSVDMFKIHLITYETLLDDEENQIMGVTHVANLKGINKTFLILFSVSEFITIVSWGEQSFPMRHKDINLLNLPAPIKYLYELAKTNLSEKLRNRITVHSSNSELVNKVDRHCLPAEYGGDMPADKMIDLWKNELAAKRNRISSFDQISLLNDRGIIRRKNASHKDNTGDGSLPGSFRKLELD